MKLYTFYETLPNTDLILRPFQQLPLPTEVVIREVGIQTPEFARAYYSDLYALKSSCEKGSSLFTYDQVRNHYEKVLGEKFPGTSSLARVVLLEWWDDRGDDGHTDYYMYGWVTALVDDVPETFYVDGNSHYDFIKKYMKEDGWH